MPVLVRPDGLSDGQWGVIREAEDRLFRASAASDSQLVVGSAKELCESIAKIVATERGDTLGRGADMPELVAAAHKALEFQPGEGLANDPETRKIAQGLKSVVSGLAELRNRHGTGHGHATLTGVTEEHANLAIDASLLWSKWALRRLEPYISGGVTALVRDLEGAIFHQGDLARRLGYANLEVLSDEDQLRLGVAVARRASGGTFVVARDGVESVDASDGRVWPAGYVEGVVNGLLLDRDGTLDPNGWKIRETSRLLAGLADPSPVLHRLERQVLNASGSFGWVSDDAVRAAVVSAIEETTGLLPAGNPQELWIRIGSHLRALSSEGS